MNALLSMDGSDYQLYRSAFKLNAKQLNVLRMCLCVVCAEKIANRPQIWLSNSIYLHIINNCIEITIIIILINNKQTHSKSQSLVGTSVRPAAICGKVNALHFKFHTPITAEKETQTHAQGERERENVMAHEKCMNGCHLDWSLRIMFIRHTFTSV